MENEIDEFGPVAGTKKHTLFQQILKDEGYPNVRFEVSYKGGNEVPRGTKGSVRFDVVLLDENESIKAIFDLKTGTAQLKEARINEIYTKSGIKRAIPIIEIKSPVHS